MPAAMIFSDSGRSLKSARETSGWKFSTQHVIWKYCQCTTYCHTVPRNGGGDNDYMMTQPPSYSVDSLTSRSCHGHSFPCSSSAPCSNYRHFLRIWDLLYGPLGTWHWSVIVVPISDLTWMENSPVFPTTLVKVSILRTLCWKSCSQIPFYRVFLCWFVNFLGLCIRFINSPLQFLVNQFFLQTLARLFP